MRSAEWPLLMNKFHLFLTTIVSVNVAEWLRRDTRITSTMQCRLLGGAGSKSKKLLPLTSLSGYFFIF